MRFPIIVFILLGFPVLEIFVTVKLAGIIGWWLAPLLILSAVAGSRLIQQEKTVVFARLFSSLQSGRPLGFAMLDSVRTLLAGVLLIFPGVVSDVLALALLLLPSPKRSRRSGPVDDGIIEGEWQREEVDIRQVSDDSASGRSHPDR